MRDYCENILEQMGYHVINLNQKEINIIDKKTFEPLARMYESKNPFFRINNEDGIGTQSICCYNDGNVAIHANGLSIYIGFHNDEFETYNVEMSNGINKIKIMVGQFFNRGKDDYVGDIGVNIFDIRTDRIIDGLDINQLSNYCEINSNNISNELPASECTTNNIMNIIIKFLKSCKEFEESKKMQEGLKCILPSLTTAVSNMLDYWKEYAIPKEILDREKRIVEYHSQIATINKFIESETEAIVKLNETLENVGNKDTKKKR